MRQLLIILLSFAATSLVAQTKKIAFESHSGSAENFNVSLSNELFDSEESDFGLPSDKSIDKVYKVTFINDSVSVIEFKRYKRPWDAKSDSLDKFIAKRKDTVHNAINRKDPVDSIKKKMSQGSYVFNDETKFVDKSDKNNRQKQKEEKPQQQQVVPLFTPNDPPDNNSPFDPTLTWMIGSILLLSVAGGFVSWKLYKPQHATA